jgi:hypothetical protein
VGSLQGEENELTLQTLRMRPHPLRMRFTAGSSSVAVELAVVPSLVPRTPLFGLRLAELYDAAEPPYEPIFGPSCAGCPTTPGDPPGTTRDRSCAHALDQECPCHRYGVWYDAARDAELRRRAPLLQRAANQILRHDTAWAITQSEPRSPGDPAPYAWSGLDWLLGVPAPGQPEPPGPEVLDYLPVPTGAMYNGGGWTRCPGWDEDGVYGFFDAANEALTAEYAAYLAALAQRYTGRLRFLELGNEPQGPYYLCPCTSSLWAGGQSCDSEKGPNHESCLTGPDSQGFVDVYGDFLYAAADIAARELAASQPEVLVITGAVDQPPFIDGLTLTTRDMITRGLLADHDNVAIGIHQYPTFAPPPWIRRNTEAPVACRNSFDWAGAGANALLKCSYGFEGQGEYYLPCGCETAPPLAGQWQLDSGRTVTARELWRFQDQRVDLSPLLEDALELGVLDLDPARNRFFMFDTELHAGFKGGGDTTTSPAREALAGVRIGAINAHQWVIGTEIISPADAGPGSGTVAAFNLLVKHLSGATPVHRSDWGTPLIGADYSGLVVKLFSRGDEDILVAWSNAAAPVRLLLPDGPDDSANCSPGGPLRATAFKRVVVTRIAATGADGTEVGITLGRPAAPPSTLTVLPLKEVFFLSVTSDRPGFGWLGSIGSAPLQSVRRHIPRAVTRTP